jgi:dipeptidyl aminopeptidase/acylaminoacyl peptidase
MLAALLAAAAPALPAVPARAPIAALDLVEVAEIGAPTLSPDGKRVAYRISRPSVADNRTALDWYVVDLAGGAPVHAGGGGTAQYEGSGGLAEQVPKWDPDSRGLRFRALVDGAVGIWHWREGGGVARELVDDADILDFELSANGRTLRYSVGATRAAIAEAERQAYANGVVADRHLDIMQPVAGGAIADGRRVMQQLPTEWFERERLLWDTPRQQRTIAVGIGGEPAPDADADFPAPRIEQGKRVSSIEGNLAEIGVDGDATRVTVTRDDGHRVQCRATVCRSSRLAALAWMPGADTLLLFEREGSARERLWSWRVGAPRARRIATTDGAQRSSYRAPRCTVAAQALVCTDSGPLRPPRLVRIDLADGETYALADPNADLRRRIAASAVEMQWDGEVTAILLRPPEANGPLPLVIQYYHCAGFLKGGVGDEIPMLPLVEHGIAVLCMDRTRTPKGGPIEAGYALALADIERAIDDLAAKGLVDPARVGIGGLSFGSEVALWAIRKSGRFAAATSSSGQISDIYYWANALPGRGFPEMLARYWQLGDPDSDRARWTLLAPAADIASIDTPLLMQLPESEARYVIEFHARLKRAGKPAEMILFADEPHIKTQPVHKRAVYERNLDWYRFWLKDEEDPHPAKRAQYLRWRQLRAGQSLPAPAP